MLGMVNETKARLSGFARRWTSDRRGSYAVIFALTLIPILIAIGAAVDLSQAYIVKQRLARALDAAGLAVGGMSGQTTAQIQATAQNYFNANYPATKIGVPGTLTVATSGNVVNLSVAASMPTSIMGIIGVHSLKVGASSQITRMGKKIEVVLVLDNTGSMSSGGRMTVLKASAKSLIDTVSAAALNDGDVKIAIVPFTTDVNVGPTNVNASWLKWSWPLPTQTCTTTGSGKNKTTTCTQDTRTVSKSGWKGCVVDRDQDYDVSISAPVSGNSATLFPANDANLYNNNCTLRPIVPFSTNWTMLKNEIDAMVAGGATNTTIGFVWGWQMLTYGATLSNAAAPNPDKLNKVMVYMTDGDNTYYRAGIGTCNGSSNCPGVDVRTAMACNAIKSSGVMVYTIRLIQGNETLLRNCATNTSMYYSANTANDLTTIFASIAQSLSNLRVSQ